MDNTVFLMDYKNIIIIIILSTVDFSKCGDFFNFTRIQKTESLFWQFEEPLVK